MSLNPNTRTTFNFFEALTLAERGYPVRRSTWTTSSAIEWLHYRQGIFYTYSDGIEKIVQSDEITLADARALNWTPFNEATFSDPQPECIGFNFSFLAPCGSKLPSGSDTPNCSALAPAAIRQPSLGCVKLSAFLTQEFPECLGENYGGFPVWADPVDPPSEYSVHDWEVSAVLITSAEPIPPEDWGHFYDQGGGSTVGSILLPSGLIVQRDIPEWQSARPIPGGAGQIYAGFGLNRFLHSGKYGYVRFRIRTHPIPAGYGQSQVLQLGRLPEACPASSSGSGSGSGGDYMPPP
ncbi:MAG: hypothetical protein AAF191_05035 [Verrucomicrobiota bacterium]